MGNYQPTLRGLFACKSGHSESKIGLKRVRVHSLDLAKEARQMAKFARCSFAKTTANFSNSFCDFHLISSVSRPQQPLIRFVLKCRIEVSVFMSLGRLLKILAPQKANVKKRDKRLQY
jgi:hypothetical protein